VSLACCIKSSAVQAASLVLALLCACSPAHAELTLARLFSEHMVLQREQENRVWGSAAPGAKVEVCVSTKCSQTTATDTGAWQVTLAAQAAGGPFEMQVSTAGDTQSITDIWFGDVWLASGQSNMEWKMDWDIDNLEAEYADSNYPQIRFFDVDNRTSEVEEETLDSGAWLPASRQTVPGFSAVAWLFAKHNHLDKNVPVGIIESNWGGTPAEAWVSRAGLAKIPAYADRSAALYDNLDDLDALIEENEENKAEKYRRLAAPDEGLRLGVHRPGYDDSDWATVSFPGSTTFNDIIWLRRHFTLDDVPADGVALELGDLVQEAFIYVNGQLIASEDNRTQAMRYDLPASLLQQGDNLIAVRIGNSWNNQPGIGARGNLELDLGERQVPLNDGWVYSTTVEAAMPIEIRFEHEPAFLYNGMIHPIRRYGMRGVIWYQGESNTGEAGLYGELFKGLIRSWRAATDQDLSFYFVQLAGFGAYRYPQADSQWAELRYQQERALELPRTGMATAFDVGEEDDIHPRDKQSVAKRLWLAARKVDFADDVDAAAPGVIGHTVADGVVELEFEDTGDALLKLGTAPGVEAFIVAGADGVFHPAEASLRGNTVVVQSDVVREPKSLRYAWSDFPKVNLYSESGLPVLPFRIDAL
jgi:sialate O-acetylesterase